MTAPASFVPSETAAGLNIAYGGSEAGAAALGTVALETIPYLGALAGIGMTAAGNEPDYIKALDAAAYAGAPFTFGLTALIPMIAELTGLKDIFRGFDIGGYAKKREEAMQTGQAQLGALGSAYQQAAETGDYPTMLRALEEAPGIRAYLSLPEQEAGQLGLERTPEGLIGWPQVYAPDKFSALMDLYQQRPELIEEIRGSGDIPYLEGDQAAGLAGTVSKQAQDFIRYMMGRRQAAGRPMAPMTSAGPVSVGVPEPGGLDLGGPLGLEPLRERG